MKNGTDVEREPWAFGDSGDEYYKGGQEIVYECKLDRIPVFVKEGSLIPVKEPLGSTYFMKNQDIEVLVYPGRDAIFKLYEDAGDGYGYEQGEYCVTNLVWKDSEKKFSYSSEGDNTFKSGIKGYVNCKDVMDE